MNDTKCPCYKCKDRVLACHDHCGRYQNWNKTRLELKAKEQFIKNISRYN